MADLKLHYEKVHGIEPGPRLLLTGGVHGDEFEPMAAIRETRRLLADPTSQPMLLRGEVTFVPVVNEGAFIRGHRKADDELDLARTCPGRDDGSITERVAASLTQLIQKSDFYIDLHTGGTELSVLPMAGYMLHDDESVLNQQRQMARVFNLPFIWGTSPDLDGRSLSIARDARVPAIYAEYGGSATCDPNGIAAYVEGCLNVMAFLTMIDRQMPESRVEQVLEDSRPGSGHMQVCNPAPLSGYFTPAVSVGDRIRSGDLLGHVSDLLGKHVCEVQSQQAGIVLVLRTFPRVNQGESVGVVVESS